MRSTLACTTRSTVSKRYCDLGAFLFIQLPESLKIEPSSSLLFLCLSEDPSVVRERPTRRRKQGRGMGRLAAVVMKLDFSGGGREGGRSMEKLKMLLCGG